MWKRFVFFMDEETGGGSGGGAEGAGSEAAGDVGAAESTGRTEAAGEVNKGGGCGGDEGVNLLRDAGKDDKEGKADKEGVEKSGEKADEAAPSVVALDQLTLPEVEGLERDEELGKSFLDIVNDEKLTRAELAQKLVDMYVAQQGGMLEAMRAAEKAAAEKWKQEDAAEQAAWVKASKEDSEFGGAKFEANMAVVAAGRDKVASPELTEIFETLGMGNHPEVLRMYYRAGKLTQEDRSAGAGGAGGSTPNPIADRIFGDVTKNL